MQSYIGVQVRERVRIIYYSWKQVPEEDKESIWEALNFIYDVDRRWRKHCLMSAGSKWRQFKVALTSFVKKAKERGANLTKAPSDYYIPQEDWNSFVLSRLSEDFMRLSELQKERQKANKYPHHLARKGYAKLEQDLESELCDDEDINRADLWKMSRCNQNGEFEGEELQETVKKIDDLIAQKEEGKLAFKKPTEDLLTAALNSGEHSGRVRGIGGSVTPSVYFGVARGKKVVDHDLYITQQKELIETRKKVSECESRLQKVEALLYSGNKKVNVEHEEKASCTVKSECDVVKNEVECQKSMLNDEKLHDHVINEKIIELKPGKAVALSLESKNDISAYGIIVSVNGPGQFLGGIPVPTNCMCVSIDHAMDENALLPVQIPGTCDNISDTAGSHVAWPVHLIHMQDEEPIKKNKIDKKLKKKDQVLDFMNMPKMLAILSGYSQGALIHGRGLMKELEEDVFGQSCRLYVFQDDITQFCLLDPISGNCIIAYIWYLYKLLKEDKKLHDYKFVNPSGVAHVALTDTSRHQETLDQRARFLAKRMLDTSSKQLLIVPCNVGEHWILTLIDPYNDVVAYMDPLCHRMRDPDWKYVVNTAFALFNSEKGRRGKKLPVWEIVKAPRQPDDKQCGFYAMWFVRDIIFQKITTIDKSSLRSLQSKGEYSAEEIDEVRNEWAECLLGLCFGDQKL